MAEQFLNTDLSFKEKELPPNDPRSYFVNTVFSSVGREIDPSVDIDWDKRRAIPWEQKYFYDKNKGSLLIGTNTINFDPKQTIVIAGQDKENSYHFSHLISDLETDQKNILIHVLTLAFELSQPEERFHVLNKIVDLQTRILKLDSQDLDFFLACLLAQNVDKKLKSRINNSVDPEVLSELSNEAEPEKIKKLASLLADRLGSPIEQVLTSISEYESIFYSRNNTRYVDLIDLLFKSFSRNEGTKETESSELSPLSFDIGPFITTDIAISDETKLQQTVKERLDQLPNNDFFSEVRGAQKWSAPQPEFVNANDILGGRINGESWGNLVNERRDKNRIPNMVKALKDGKPINFFDQKEPISLLRYKNKLMVYGDGTHRVAALKVLGVTRFPALVTSVE